MAELLPLPGGMNLLLNVPPGTCDQCATAHDPRQPHNAQSLTYQYWFYGHTGGKRWPNWEDAMAHCDEDVKAIWRAELRRMGVDIDNGKVNPG